MPRYWNSTFEIRADAKRMKRTQMKRRRKPISRSAGKKTRANKRANATRKRVFEAKHVTRCELGYRGCTPDNFLTWAHGKKRRKLKGDELTSCAILACVNCHNVIERMSPESMLAIVESVIVERGWTVRDKKGSE